MPRFASGGTEESVRCRPEKRGFYGIDKPADSDLEVLSTKEPKGNLCHDIGVALSRVPSVISPIATLVIRIAGKGPSYPAHSEPVYGGYSNSRGEVVLFGKEQAYRVDFKRQSLQPRPQLNVGAQARYDEARAGESFEYGKKTFQRLSEQQITEICAAGDFKLSQRQLPF